MYNFNNAKCVTQDALKTKKLLKKLLFKKVQIGRSKIQL